MAGHETTPSVPSLRSIEHRRQNEIARAAAAPRTTGICMRSTGTSMYSPPVVSISNSAAEEVVGIAQIVEFGHRAVGALALPAGRARPQFLDLGGGGGGTGGIAEPQQDPRPHRRVLRRRRLVALEFRQAAFGEDLPAQHLGPQQLAEFEHRGIGLCGDRAAPASGPPVRLRRRTAASRPAASGRRHRSARP